MTDYTYLVLALKGYRERTIGQFDQATESPVRITQDAAEAIETLQARVSELERDNFNLKEAAKPWPV